MTESPTDTQIQKSEPNPAPGRFRRPAYDVHEAEADYQIRVLMPGVAKDGADVSLDGRNLAIRGTRSYRPDENWRTILSELDWDDYRLNLELNVPVNEDAVQARVENGVLQLTLPKPEEVKPRTIEVQ